jgi:hypothetical protein
VAIRNALFISNWNVSAQADLLEGYAWRTRHIIVEDDGRLEIFDCDLVFTQRIPGESLYCGLLLFDRAIVNVTQANFVHESGGGEFIYLHNTSQLRMADVALSTYNPGERYFHPKSGIWSYDEADVQAQGSLVDEIRFYGNCTARFNALQVEEIQTGNSDGSQLKAFDSTVDELSTWPSARSSIWLDNCTIGDLVIRGDATVWLHNSLEVDDSIPSSGEILVLWDVPLIGQVAIPHGWAPYMLPAIAASLMVVVALASVILFLKARKRSKSIRVRARRLG